MLNHSESSSKSTIINNNFVVMDIETIKPNNEFIPYLICAYNGSDYISSFGNNQYELFSNFIKSLLTFFVNDSKTLVVYAHNFASFDGVLLLKHLIPFGKVEPLLFHGKLITIKLKLDFEGHRGKTIIFKDSYLLLPFALRKLALIFNTSENKGIFPFNLSNIFYSGIFPRFEYFININIATYLKISQEFNNKTWNFKDEAIKYCKLDCLILFEILIKFNELVFNEFKININKVLTLPALSMKIFKTLFMENNTIYQIHSKVEKILENHIRRFSSSNKLPINSIILDIF